MNDWYQRMIATLQLNGKGEPTQKGDKGVGSLFMLASDDHRHS